MKAYRKPTLKFLSLSTGMFLITVILSVWMMDVASEVNRRGVGTLNSTQSTLLWLVPIMLSILILTAVGFGLKLVAWYDTDINRMKQKETCD